MGNFSFAELSTTKYVIFHGIRVDIFDSTYSSLPVLVIFPSTPLNARTLSFLSLHFSFFFLPLFHCYISIHFMPFPICNLCTVVPYLLIFSLLPQLLYGAHQCLGFLSICQVFSSKYIQRDCFPLHEVEAKGKDEAFSAKISLSVLCQSGLQRHNTQNSK